VRAAIVSASLSEPARAGLWLLHDFFDESHAISQDLNTPDGSYWHAILHRREPDAFNAKYWFRRVGNHPILTNLKKQAAEIGYRYSTPEAFVDFCQQASGTKDESLAIDVQMLEWRLLFDHCR
jgi:hypothetical protein